MFRAVYSKPRYPEDGWSGNERERENALGRPVGLDHSGPNSTFDWLLCHCVIMGGTIHLPEPQFPFGEQNMLTSQWPEHWTEPGIKSVPA